MSFISEYELKDWDDKNRALYEYWQSIHPEGGGIPGRQHLDPADIPSLLPNVWLVDVYKEPLRFKFRLFGTSHYDAMKGDYTGQWIDEAFPHFERSNSYFDYVNLVKTNKVSHRRGPATFHIPDHKSLERVMLPLAENGRDVDMILALTIYL